MNVYLLKPDTSFRMLYPEDKIYDSENWEFKCESLIEKLPSNFSAYFDPDSKKPLPDIAYLGMTTFAFRSDVASKLVDILEKSGELIPFVVEDEIWYCLNVIKAQSALDPEKTSYEVNEGGVRLGIKEYVFNEKELHGTPLFKIKNDNFTNIYCVDRRENDKQILNNFYCAVVANKFTGIVFKNVYEN